MSAHYGTAIAAAMRAGNMIAPSYGGGGPQQEYAELSATSKQEQLRHAALLKRVDAEKRARRIVVPTSDKDVRGMLRKLGHPVRLFGETLADVRERLRELLARIEIEGEERDLVAALLAQPDPLAPADAARDRDAHKGGDRPQREAKTDVFTPASAHLIQARRRVADASFRAARKRLQKAKALRDDDDARAAHEQRTAECYASLGALRLSQSQFADARPVARVRCSPAANFVATGAWSGAAKVWDAETCEQKCVLKASGDRVTGLAWHPRALTVAVGTADGNATLWDVAAACAGDAMETDGKAPAGTLLHTFRGHRARLGNVEFHPHGSHVATASFDHTWRLWDCSTGQELLLQDGHAHEVYAIAFQPDGALVATGDFAGVVHLWDCRSGRAVHACMGHGKKVLAADFNVDGFHLATGGDDHTVRIWDLRRKAAAYTLPAHSSLIGDVRWAPDTGEALATASFDGSVKVWCARDWSCLAELTAHDGKAMSVDFGPKRDDGALVSSGFDRTFKLWAPEWE